MGGGSVLQPVPSQVGGPGGGGSSILQPMGTGPSSQQPVGGGVGGGASFMADFSAIKELDTISTEIDDIKK